MARCFGLKLAVLQAFFLLLFCLGAFGVPHFRISSFSIAPNELFVEVGDSAIVEPVVVVDNIGDSGKAFVKIKVVDSEGSDVVLVNVPPRVVSVSEEFSSAGGDPISFDVKSDAWEPGIYAVYANVFDQGGSLQDSRIRHLNVAFKRSPIPELGLFLLPAIALSALLGMFLSGRRQG